MKRFVEGEDRTQITLLPECLDDYVGEDNPVRVVEVFVDERRTEQSCPPRQARTPCESPGQRDIFAYLSCEAKMSLRLCAKQIRHFADARPILLRMVLIHEGFRRAL